MGRRQKREEWDFSTMTPEERGQYFDGMHDASRDRSQAKHSNEGGGSDSGGDQSGNLGGSSCALYVALASLAALGWPAAHAVHLLF
jgi:hypothetical protein